MQKIYRFADGLHTYTFQMELVGLSINEILHHADQEKLRSNIFRQNKYYCFSKDRFKFSSTVETVPTVHIPCRYPTLLPWRLRPRVQGAHSTSGCARRPSAGARPRSTSTCTWWATPPPGGPTPCSWGWSGQSPTGTVLSHTATNVRAGYEVFEL